MNDQWTIGHMFGFYLITVYMRAYLHYTEILQRSQLMEGLIQIESNECLDWQSSQFINIVGKDHFIQKGVNFTGRGCVNCSKSGFRRVRSSQTCSPPSPHSPREFSEFPPTLPQIVADVAAHGQLGGRT
jgi:hypothetical protein